MTLNLSLLKTPEGSPAITRDVQWEIARMVQERIFPASRPAIPGLDYFADWRPARGVSGDHIDYFEMRDGQLGLAVGHVSSQGLPAALLNPFLHCMVRTWRYARNSSPRELVRSVHEWFYEICPDNCHATLFVATYDPASGELRYVNAGHEPPVVLQKNGAHYRTVFLEASGPVIGMLRRSAYRENVVSLRPGDVVAAYSDGLCETRNRSGEAWGWPRFIERMEGCAGQKARDIVEGIMQATETFAGGAPQSDDATLWVGRVEDVANLPRWKPESAALVGFEGAAA